MSQALILATLNALKTFSSKESLSIPNKLRKISRQFAIRPKYLFYDEPTTGLDPIMTDIINKLIIKFQKNYNITSVIVTHERRTVFDVAERVIMLNKGKICFNGSSDEIQKSEVKVIKQFITGNSEMVKLG